MWIEKGSLKESVNIHCDTHTHTHTIHTSHVVPTYSATAEQQGPTTLLQVTTTMLQLETGNALAPVVTVTVTVTISWKCSQSRGYHTHDDSFFYHITELVTVITE